MRKITILCIMWALLKIPAVFLIPGEAQEASSEQLMQSAGYPKLGDIPVLNRKIFKGKRVSIREHPYVVSIRRMVTHYITGALLTRNTVVTVAHPLHNVPVMELSVVVGENYSDRGSTLLTVVLVIIHEDFDPYTLKNDIAMLRLYEEIKRKGNVKWILLTSPIASLAGEKAFVTGWGRCDNMGTELCLDRSSKYYPEEKIDSMLRTITFTMNFPNYYCDGYKRHEVTILPGMLCTGVAREEDPVCPCLGVPGAPLVAGARLVGLLSWGFGCDYSYDRPLIYTNMQYFYSWIAHNIKILSVIYQKNLTDIFMATKASILVQWLMETRIITPKLLIRMDKNFELLSIDQEIIKLRGSVYDVRDYIADGAFHDAKAALYETFRSGYVKVHDVRYQKPDIAPPLPFIGNQTLKEIGFNTSGIFSNVTIRLEIDDSDVSEDEDTHDDYM